MMTVSQGSGLLINDYFVTDDLGISGAQQVKFHDDILERIFKVPDEYLLTRISKPGVKGGHYD
jgi:hypothetical protein